MTSTVLGVRRTERYVYNSLHWAFPMPVAVGLLYRGDAPLLWWLAWLLVAGIASWSGLVVLHSRLRAAQLLPPSGWDLARVANVKPWLWLWIGAGPVMALTAGWTAAGGALEATVISVLTGSVLAMPLLTWPRVHSTVIVLTGIVLGQPALWLGSLPTTPDDWVARVALAWWSTFATFCVLGYTVMFRNVLVTTRELERARHNAARLAVSEERLRFSRDLHDVFGRTLSAVALKAELAAEQATRGRPEAVATMREVQGIATTALSEVREVVRGYRESDLTSEIAGAAGLLEASGVTVSTVTEGDAVLPAPVGRAFGWVVREGATNLLRHSEATRARLQVTSRSDVARLELTNDRPRPVAVDGDGGWGLAGLSERLAEVGGTLTVRHEPDSFTLTAQVDAAALADLRAAGAEAGAGGQPDAVGFAGGGAQ